MRVAVVSLLALAACSDDAAPPQPDAWTQAVTDFVDAVCTSPCRSGSEAQCRSDVGDELARAMIALTDPASQAKCENCLEVKAMLEGELASCMPTADQDAMVAAACDLDPNNDSDGDGDPADDYSDACFGEP